MNTSKWLRSVLLGGVAVSVMATGAQADELSDMKAQLEALQSRVNTIETAPSANLPAGTNLLAIRRGQSSDARLNSMGYNVRDGVNPTDRGLTISVTPTADLPAPVTEITVYGYTAGYVNWTNETMAGTTGFGVPGILDNTKSEFNLYARARFGIRAKTDTAIGQVRAHMEFQSTGSGSNYGRIQTRHMYGEWDMTPNWTLLVGQTWLTAGALDFGVSTVDTTGWAGPSITRTPMVRLTYKNGPITWKTAIEDPTFSNISIIAAGGAGSINYPNIATHIKYDAAGGHQIWAAGKVADYGIRTGWMIQGGANINLGDMATFTGVMMYGKGEPLRTNFQLSHIGGLNAVGNPLKILAAGAGVSFNVSETTTFNAIWGWTKAYNNIIGQGKSVHTVHANIMWRPVKQMRLGWEVMWGKQKLQGGGKQDAIRGTFGAWFFF